MFLVKFVYLSLTIKIKILFLYREMLFWLENYQLRDAHVELLICTTCPLVPGDRNQKTEVN